MWSLFAPAALGFAVAFVVALLLTPWVRRLALERGWVDRPDGDRKLHANPTPALGGIAIFAGVVAGLAVVAAAAPALGLPGFGLPPVVILGALAMAGTGFWDDLRGLGFKTKLAVEIVVAYALLISDQSYLIDLTAVPFIGADPYTHALFAIPITLVWIVGVMNAINLIDGVDGLAAGVAGIALASLAVAFGAVSEPVLLVAAVVMIGGLLGFLRHNFNPASIFMGDSGSLFIGFVLAVYTLSGDAHPDPLVALIVPLVALGLPIFDTTLSMVRRAIGRQAIMAPDRDHIHHRMTQRMSVRRAVAMLYLVAAGFGLVAIAISQSSAAAAPWWVGFAILGAAAFATTLGYVRRPYMAPALIDSAGSAPRAPASPPVEGAALDGGGPEPGLPDLEEPSGDGTMVAATLDTGKESDPPDLTLSPTP